jgi:hypothetical protein
MNIFLTAGLFSLAWAEPKAELTPYDWRHTTYLQVFNPISLQDKLGNFGKLKTKLADFGHLNYGTSFIATLYHPIKA